MSLYISPQNQTLLWNTIQKSEFIHIIPSQESRQEWFRSIIAKFYTMNPSVVSNEGLSRVNQDTIKFMIQDLRQRGGIPTKPPSHVTFSKGTKDETNKVPAIDRSSEYSRNQPNRTDVLQNSFELRKQEYEAMYKKPDTPIVTFTEKIEDQTIKNMDELIQEQLKMRELDLPNYPIGPTSPTPPSASASASSTDVDKKELNAIEIELIEESPIEIKVRTLEEKIIHLQQEILEMRATFAKVTP